MELHDELVEQRKENGRLLTENRNLKKGIRRDIAFFMAMVTVLGFGNMMLYIETEETHRRFSDVAENAQSVVEYETKVIQAYQTIIDDYDRLVDAHNELSRQVTQQEVMWNTARRRAAQYGFYLFPEDVVEPENPYEAPDFPEFPNDADDAEDGEEKDAHS